GGKMRLGYVKMTTGLMEQFGQKVQSDDVTLTYRVEPGNAYPNPPRNFVVEPDASAASYFLALPLATGGEVAVEGLGQACLQADLAFVRVLEAAGLQIERDLSTWVARAPKEGAGRGVLSNFYEFSDTFLTLAALTPLLQGETTIAGIAHTRKQETDRVSAMTNELRKLGQRVDEHHDLISIKPDRLGLKTLARTARPQVKTYEDHRIAMSFGILGCCDIRNDGHPWLRILDPHCTSKTFPDFFERLDELRETSLAGS
ncbi:MAG: 3-phosphoshikimate 1-carboxyvinyltransferase, partial [Verrucomicrobiota bacterium]